MFAQYFCTGFSIFRMAEYSPRLGVQHAHAVRYLPQKIDVLKDTLTLASGTERIDRQGHAGTQGDKSRMMYKVISKYNKKGRSTRISGGRPAFNIQQDHTLPVMVFLFFSQFLRVGVDIHSATVFLGMQPFPLFEHDKRNTRRDDRNQHDQSGHETHEQ